MTHCIKCKKFIPPCECFENEGLDRYCTTCQTEVLLTVLDELTELRAIKERLLTEWHAANDAAYRDAQSRDVCERVLGYVPAGRKDIFGDLEVSE